MDEAQREVHRQLGLACRRRAHHHHNIALARHSGLHACTHTTVAVVKLQIFERHIINAAFPPKESAFLKKKKTVRSFSFS
jgi:hypothetical protein